MSDAAIVVNPWMMLPFGILLALIALAPLGFPYWWEKHYPKVVCGLAIITLGYYFIGLRVPAKVWHATHEYCSFIALIGSLFIVSGGIHINVKGQATPFANSMFLLTGAIAANILGTTGASMLLIRPWLSMNKERIKAFHVVFFIFIISNVGGCLTPIGDPPLFLGYLIGIPFWWVAEHCLPIWAVGVGLLLLFFFVLDYRNHLRASNISGAAAPMAKKGCSVEGLGNVWFLAIIIGAVFIRHPPLLREGLMGLAAAGSYFTTRKSVHKSNHFDFHPITEVAILFAGIFATMMPALDWLRGNAGVLANVSASVLYWCSGSLSSVLDNAPTYACFLKGISSHFNNPEIIGQVGHLIHNHGADLANISGPYAEQIRNTFMALQNYQTGALAKNDVSAEQIEIAYLLGNFKFNGYITAISVGSVFFGANTYIGNGPNFMVKSIAEHQQIPIPGFLGYICKFTLPIMLPILLIIWWIFFCN